VGGSLLTPVISNEIAQTVSLYRVAGEISTLISSYFDFFTREDRFCVPLVATEVETNPGNEAEKTECGFVEVTEQMELPF
jgi:hypothetical protein